LAEQRYGPPGFAPTYEISFLYRGRPEFDSARLIERLNSSVKSEAFFASDDMIGIGHTGHRIQMQDQVMPMITNVVRFNRKFDRRDFDKALEQTWDWEQAADVVGRCKHRVLLGDTSGFGLPYKERYAVLSAAAEAWAAVTNPDAVFWEVAGCIVEPAALHRRLAHHCNVRLYEEDGEEGRVVMDTLGLAAIGLPDVQIDFVNLQASWRRTRVSNQPTSERPFHLTHHGGGCSQDVTRREA
jgi:hypothetical protein